MSQALGVAEGGVGAKGLVVCCVPVCEPCWPGIPHILHQHTITC